MPCSGFTLDKLSYNLNLYNPIKDNCINEESCFLCGETNPRELTKEHVFPKWLNKSFNLWDQKLILLNETKIPYRNLKIPCCSHCNNVHLSKIENMFKKHALAGYDSVIELDEKIVFQWCAKLFYGILFKELNLHYDRSNIAKGTILNSHSLDQLSSFFLCLQSIRIPCKFYVPKPWSIFLLKIKINKSEPSFNYIDSFSELCISVKIGEIGIIASFLDNESVKNHNNHIYRNLIHKSISHLQFQEMVARVFYSKKRLNRVSHIFVEKPLDSKEMKVQSLPIVTLSKKTLFKVAEPFEYANYFLKFIEKWGFTINDIFAPPDKVRSFLDDGKGQVQTKE